MKRIVSSFIFASIALSAGQLSSQDLFIHELLAVNRANIDDEDGDSSDWLELHNASTTVANLDGWYLTDDPILLEKWRFPAVLIQPGDYLVVFASGKNRAVAGQELHTNFQLDGDGEFLALVRPDGSVAHDFGLGYPTQHEDISYGVTNEVTTLIDLNSTAHIFVPTSGALGLDWTLPEFTPGASWQTITTTSIGFDEGGQNPAGLLSYWPFDGDLDDRRSSNDGSFFGGAPEYVSGFDGAPGSALQFDGQNDYVSVAQNDQLPISNHETFSFAAWVKGPPQPDRRIFSEGSSTNNSPVYTIGVDQSGATGKVDLYIRNESGTALLTHVKSDRIAFEANEWHHIVWTDDNGSGSIYIDGIRDATSFDYSKQFLPLNRTSIGAILRATDSFHFQGVIDEVAIWTRILDENEIAQLAAGGSPLSLSSLGHLFEEDITAAMHGINSSIYVRMPFVVNSPADLATLQLRIMYDDGFALFLNGVEVARRNAPEELAWNAAASDERSIDDVLVAETINLTAHLDLLIPGDNVLAIHGLNAAADDADFLLATELIASTSLTEFRYFETPTPGGPNQGGFIDFVADTTFSHDRGYYDTPFDVEITSATEGATIRYTLDASAPTADTGILYDGPIHIDRTTTLRAAAFKDGHEPTNVDTQTYIFISDVLQQTRPDGYPTSWGGISADYDMDPEIVGDARFAASFEESFASIPTLSLVLDVEDIFGGNGIYQNPRQTGTASERPASAEFIYDGDDVQVGAGLRPFGNKARSLTNTPKIGLRLVFKGKYGARKLRFAVFPDSPVEDFDTIVVRPNYVDSWLEPSSGRRQTAQYIRDQWVRDAQGRTGQLTVHGIFAHLFINGMYWGLYNLTERADASFAAEHLGGDKEEYDSLKTHEELVDGSLSAYNQLKAIANAGIRTLEDYEDISNHLDVDNMIDYMIVNMFSPALDWPGNYYMVTRREEGARFKFLSWDSEEAFLEGINANRTATHWRDVDSPTQFHHALRQSAEYRLRFADRLHKHFFNDGILTATAITESWDDMAESIAMALICESARWGDYRRSVPYIPQGEWQTTRDNYRESFLPSRRDIVFGQFQCQPDWAGCTPLYQELQPPELNQFGGFIEPGFELSLSASAGDIYYTLDGSDPRLPGGAVSPDASLLGAAARDVFVALESIMQYHIPENGDLGLDWIDTGFDDSQWFQGLLGIGFDGSPMYEPFLHTDIQAWMHGITTSVYIRIPLDIAAPDTYDRLVLRMKYDDGFLAYLNGTLVASANAPEIPAWDSESSRPHADADAIVFEDFEITDFMHLLEPGANLLAIQGLNATTLSGDMLILPELVGFVSDESSIILDETTVVMARARDVNTWSALTETTFVVDTPLRITEIMYHPRDPEEGSPFDADDFEFIELQNIGSHRVDLAGMLLEGGISFDFNEALIDSLAPGAVAVLIKNSLAFSSRHDLDSIPLLGVYSGRLNNTGELLRLLDADGQAILDFRYDDDWLKETDGLGPSLVIRDVNSLHESWGDAESWSPSTFSDGSPGIDENNPLPESSQLPGDANQDGDLNLSDAVRLLIHLFIDASIPLPCDGALDEGGNLGLLDSNGDASVNLSDAAHLLGYLFNGGPAHVLGTECISIEGCPSRCK